MPFVIGERQDDSRRAGETDMGGPKHQADVPGVDATVRELEAVAARLAIPVRYEKGDLRGGLCKLHGQWQIILNADLTDEEKSEILAESLAPMNLDSVYVPPRIRQLLEEDRRDCREDGSPHRRGDFESQM